MTSVIQRHKGFGGIVETVPMAALPLAGFAWAELPPSGAHRHLSTQHLSKWRRMQLGRTDNHRLGGHCLVSPPLKDRWAEKAIGYFCCAEMIQ